MLSRAPGGALGDTAAVLRRRGSGRFGATAGARRRGQFAALLAAAVMPLGCMAAPEPSVAPSGSATASTSPPLTDACPGGQAAGGETAVGVGARLASTRGDRRRRPVSLHNGSGEEAAPAAWRLCLASGEVVEGPGLCHWSADRSEVLWMAGEDVPGLGAIVGPFLALDEEPDVLVLDRSNRAGILAGYRPTGASAISVETTSNAAAGIATFEDLRLHDPATGDPAGPGWNGPEAPSVDGVLRWTCTAAPPFSEGWGPGVVRVRIDEPARELSWQTSCWWGLIDAGDGQLVPMVTSVEGDYITAGDQEISIHLVPFDERAPFALTTSATRGEESRSSTYTAGDDPPVVSGRAPDGASGQLRFTGWRRLQPVDGNPEEPLGGPDGPQVIDGTVDWQCGEPRGRLVEVDPTDPPPEP